MTAALPDPNPPDPEARRAWLAAFRDQTRAERDALAAREARWSWARLLSFLPALLGWYVLYPILPVGIGVSLVSLAAFFQTVRVHLRLRIAREMLDRKLVVAEETERRSAGRVVLIRDWRHPRDPGESGESADAATGVPPIAAFVDDGPTWELSDQERDDLDLYAPPVGLFGLLNRTSTLLGARRLAELLDRPCLSAEHIRARQACVNQLADASAARLALLAGLVEFRGEERRLGRMVAAIHGAAPLKLSLPVDVLRIWSLAGGAAALAAGARLAVGDFQWTWVLALVALLNGALLWGAREAISAAIDAWRDTGLTLGAFRTAARVAAQELRDGGSTDTDRRAAALAEIHAASVAVLHPDALPRLCRRTGWSERGGAMHFALNVLFLFDMHVAHGILSAAVPHKAALERGLGALAELEALLSLACFAWEEPDTCTPVPVGEARVEIHDGRHALVAPARVVANGLTLHADERLWLITGSNMSGKSTFLRMVATNVLLAQMGSAVLASAMRWSPLRLMTDLRARDNLTRGESYFLAEVRQLRRMVLAPHQPGPLLGVIDEPFRGTNTQEQSAASYAVIRHLLSGGGLYLVATHDRLLTLLAESPGARNFHFREEVRAGGLAFDYRLRPGPAQTRNALRVLAQEGYPRELLEWAHSWIAEHHDRGGSTDVPPPRPAPVES